MPTLDWLDRNAAFRIAERVPTRVLRPHAQGHEFGDVAQAGAGNLLIQGDNLEALKALLPFYRGRVKCIFIDPPYNTRSAFEHYDDNLEHSQWLSMMLPRLQLLRELLAEDGSIWVHLDDNESHYNKVLMDEVFGRQNFVANIGWQKSYAVRSNAEFFSTSVENIAVYARQRAALQIAKFGRSEDQLARFDNPDNDPRGRWQSITMTISLMSGARGRQFAKTGVSANVYEVRAPTGRPFMPPARRCWSRSPEEFERLDRDGRIWWGREGNSPPRMKMFLSESDFAATESVQPCQRPRPRQLPRQRHRCRRRPQNGPALDRHRDGRARRHPLPAAAAQGGRRRAGGLSAAVGWQGGGNVLTSAVLAALRAQAWREGPKVIYGEACRLGAARLAAEGITFKQLPHAVPR